ncbi:hhH-GPD superfamily base excision DNA repair protein domain-containing protein [Ditylenchus destructor]|uniref:HhH-GPD superfamily base excision DNA repair protein domain-containing protein n=1 Tax=Ditylenchus destructor TaxID=166010 RepID=A0AAD4NGF2_9BILA|nr:hhH-GPD superfamily base excision DNA repair protein domain-containing protein [Ditylenchus destructor]
MSKRKRSTKTVEKVEEVEFKEESIRGPFPQVETKDIEDICKETLGTSAICELPPNIAEHINFIEEMRKTADAPVDTMGCHMLADSSADPKRLRAHGCTLDSIISLPTDQLQTLLCPVGFYKRKAEYLQKTALLLKEKYDSDIPDTLVGLCGLPGVGPKMAHLALQIAFNKTEGIGVDTHVHRIANRLKWVKTNSPEQTEAKLKEILPKAYWSTVNKLLVGFGQQICTPVRPKCGDCLNMKACPWSDKKLYIHKVEK